MTKSTKTIIIAAALTMLASFPANSASIEEFQTEEYYGSGGLNLINAAEAYSKGYTGKGITIGINDQPVNLNHEAFSGKTGSEYIGSLELNGVDWNENYHGTHVSGIAAGAKNDKYMHGVAFEADIINTCYFDDGNELYKNYSYPEIKSINCSWGYDIAADELYSSSEVKEDLTSNEVFEKVIDGVSRAGYDYENYYKPFLESDSNNKLLIFAIGNLGQHETDISQFLNWVKGDSNKNLLFTTAALNSYGDNIHLKRNSDGSITGDFINTPFTNLAKYNEDYILSASGWCILSSYSCSENDYIIKSGTSLAAPCVTGCAALVQQAFPYLNSKQIADVLLSTANNNINTEYPFTVTNHRHVDEYGNYTDNYTANIYYLDGRTESSDEQVKNDIITYIKALKEEGDKGKDNANNLEKSVNNGLIKVFYQTPIQEFVGQGILDAGKAVSGPGALNARRLEKDNISSKYLTDGQKTAMYEIDTKGYDSVWSNDIKEIKVGKLANNNTEEDLKERYNYYNVNWLSNDKADKWAKTLTKAYVEEFNERVDKNGLEGLHVGLIKSGKGILKLEGNNTYKGATVVTDGTIAVNGSVAGDAYSEKKALLWAGEKSAELCTTIISLLLAMVLKAILV